MIQLVYYASIMRKGLKQEEENKMKRWLKSQQKQGVIMVPEAELEPARCCQRQILSLLVVLFGLNVDLNRRHKKTRYKGGLLSR